MQLPTRFEPPLTADQAERLAQWQAQGVALAVELRTEAGLCGPGQLYYRDFDSHARTRRALSWLGALWAVALATLVIPIVHFVLPPLLLIAGPIVAIRIGHTPRVVFGGLGVCPKCRQPLWIGGVPLRLPLRETCARCYVAVQVVALEPVPPPPE